MFSRRWVLLVLLAACLGACAPQQAPAAPLVSTLTIDGTEFAITDAAISSDCLSLVFSVNGYIPPPGTDPQRAFPPVEEVSIRAVQPDLALEPAPLRGGGGGGGQTEDGRVWMHHEMLYSLGTAVPEGTEVTLEVTAALNKTFGQADPLRYRIAIVAGPGGGVCAAPQAAP